MSSKTTITNKDINTSDLANISIRLAQVLNAHLKEQPKCTHPLDEIIREAFFD